MKKSTSIYWLIGLTIFCIDRVTKWAALIWCSDTILYNQFLSFELVVNRGISWGMFHSSNSIAFAAVSLIIAMVTVLVCLHAVYFLRRECSIFGQVCIIAGSLSNMVDRVYYSGVIDFIIVSYNQFSWPVFNVADMAIVVGVGILLFQHDA